MSPYRTSFTAAMEGQQQQHHHRSPPYTVFIEGNVGSGKTTFLEQFADCPNVFTAKEPVNKWQDVCGHNFLVRKMGVFFFFMTFSLLCLLRLRA